MINDNIFKREFDFRTTFNDRLFFYYCDFLIIENFKIFKIIYRLKCIRDAFHFNCFLNR